MENWEIKIMSHEEFEKLVKQEGWIKQEDE
jgi:hypothetical protein